MHGNYIYIHQKVIWLGNNRYLLRQCCQYWGGGLGSDFGFIYMGPDSGNSSILDLSLDFDHLKSELYHCLSTSWKTWQMEIQSLIGHGHTTSKWQGEFASLVEGGIGWDGWFIKQAGRLICPLSPFRRTEHVCQTLCINDPSLSLGFALLTSLSPSLNFAKFVFSFGFWTKKKISRALSNRAWSVSFKQQFGGVSANDSSYLTYHGIYKYTDY